MTSDQDTKVVAEPQVQPVQEAKESARLVSGAAAALVHLHRDVQGSQFSCQFQELWVIDDELSEKEL